MKHQEDNENNRNTINTLDIEAQFDVLFRTSNWDGIIRLLTDDILEEHKADCLMVLRKSIACFQLGKATEGKQYMRLAQENGASPKDIAKHILSSLNYSLAKCELYKDNFEEAQLLLRKSYGYMNYDVHNKNGYEIDVSILKEMNIFKKNQNHQFDGLDFHEKIIIDQMKDFSNSTEASAIAIAEALVEQVFSKKESVEVLETLNEYLLSNSYDNAIKYHICLTAARYSFSGGDTHIAVHFINSAIEWIEPHFAAIRFRKLANQALQIGNGELAIDHYIKSWENETSHSEEKVNLIKQAYNHLRAASKQKQQHGHDLLISYIKQQNMDSNSVSQGKVLVEIGTTREDVPGQGSTMQLAELCNSFGFHFITVDMDPNNGKMAQNRFQQLGFSFEAVNQKGEDFLSEYTGKLDYIFLDAYDFDHGKHSELRQSRYKKYLGSTIDEQQCHKMHLDCATTLVQKLSDDGIICIDDTWQDSQNNWTAKGTTAVPYLLGNGFEIVEARNRAVLLKRKRIVS